MAKKEGNAYKPKPHRKKSRQGSGLGTKTGKKKGELKQYRGQGGSRKRVKH